MFGVGGRVIAGATGERHIDPDAQIHFNRLSSPSTALKNALNTLIVGLKADGIWDNIYAICVQHNVQGESLYDLKGTQDSTNLTGATWSSAGWSLGNDTGLIDTQVVPTSSSGMVAANDNHLMLYLATTLTDVNATLMGGSNSLNDHIAVSYGISSALAMAYQGDSFFAGDNARLTITTPSGCVVGSLLANASAIRVGASEATATETPTNPTCGNLSLYVGTSQGALGNITNPSETFTAWASGSGLTATQRADYYTHIQDYMVTMGWEA